MPGLLKLQFHSRTLHLPQSPPQSRHLSQFLTHSGLFQDVYFFHQFSDIYLPQSLPIEKRQKLPARKALPEPLSSLLFFQKNLVLFYSGQASPCQAQFRSPHGTDNVHILEPAPRMSVDLPSGLLHYTYYHLLPSHPFILISAD